MLPPHSCNTTILARWLPSCRARSCRCVETAAAVIESSHANVGFGAVLNAMLLSQGSKALAGNVRSARPAPVNRRLVCRAEGEEKAIAKVRSLWQS